MDSESQLRRCGHDNSSRQKITSLQRIYEYTLSPPLASVQEARLTWASCVGEDVPDEPKIVVLLVVRLKNKIISNGDQHKFKQSVRTSLCRKGWSNSSSNFGIQDDVECKTTPVSNRELSHLNEISRVN
ncbi:hypothetical protein FRC03_002922 [Tulasnella sp. 419]|nr:hypothetical protein FRC03_002922 [Tulasnella sp. 419]